MGVDTKIRLPGNVRIDDVATVMGLLAGLPCDVRTITYDGGRATTYTKCTGVSLKDTVVVGMACIDLQAQDSSPLVDGETRHFVYYHFEHSRTLGFAGDTGRLLNPPSTPFWIAIGKKLVDFFGGEVDYSDCDDVECDYYAPCKSNKENCPEDGKAWRSLQTRMAAVKPVVLESGVV